ncbi:MAG: TlpA disulfide reductase family protein [Arcicella sp.]|nr:TlpA disulfide reductase family protein [Arcicella sp.]
MKNLFLLSAYLLLFSFFSNCTSDSTKKGETTQNVAQVDSIEVNYPWTPDPKNEADDIIIYGSDEFGEYPFVPGINKISNNVFLRNISWHSGAIYPIIDLKYKSIKIDSINEVAELKTGDLKTDNFLNFYARYRKYEDPIKTPEDSFKSLFINNKKYSENPDNQAFEVEKRYQKKMQYLIKYAKEYKLDSLELSQWKLILNFGRISDRLGMFNFANDKWTKAQVQSFVNLKSEFQGDNPYIKTQNYSWMARQMLKVIKYAQTGNLKPDFKVDYKIAEDNFKGQTRDLLLTYLMVDEGKKLSKTDFENYQKRFISTCKTERYVDYFQKSVMPMNDKISATSLYDVNKKLVDFKEITSKNKITYVDFWANWCAPCRAEMPDSKKLRDEYASKGVNFVYISIDENAADWDKANKKIGLPDNMSFLLPNPSENPLKKQFKINSIPRYMLIDKNGKVIDDDAPRPSDKGIRGVLDELLK